MPRCVARLLDSYRAVFREGFGGAVGGQDGAQPTTTWISCGWPPASREPTRWPQSTACKRNQEPAPTEVALLIGMLASSHRFIYAVLSVEAGILPSARPAIRDEFRVFANDVNRTSDGLVARAPRSRMPRAQKWPDLREDHRRLTQNPLSSGEQYALVNVEADRMTNSLNTLTRTNRTLAPRREWLKAAYVSSSSTLSYRSVTILGLAKSLIRTNLRLRHAVLACRLHHRLVVPSFSSPSRRNSIPNFGQ